MKHWLFFLVSGAFLLGTAHGAERPNIVLLLADDLGWNGLGCYGSDLHETPNLDRLAAEGVRFTDAYAACTVCSPTRAAVMTGMYPARLHVTNWIPGTKLPYAKLSPPDWTLHLEQRHTTIAEALQAAGYHTAHIGKWHLGGGEFLPEHQGFDVNIGGTESGSPPGGYFLPNKLDLPEAKEGDYLTDHLTTQCLKLIDQWKDEPFFIYFPYYVVHTPIQGKPELVKKYEGLIKDGAVHDNAAYAAMTQSLDESAGRVLAKLEELGLTENTLVIFSSDNGGLSHKYTGTDKLGETGITDNAPLRRGKGSAYEGGHRVPLIVKWPGVTQPGGVCADPVCSIDFYRTILAASGAPGEAAHNATMDGLSLVPLLKNPKASLEREALFWHFPHYHAGNTGPYGAVRAGSWKLIERYEDGSLELYNLAEDLSETTNLATQQPDRAKTLRTMLENWRQATGAQLMHPNPDYDPQRARQGPGKREKPEE